MLLRLLYSLSSVLPHLRFDIRGDDNASVSLFLLRTPQDPLSSKNGGLRLLSDIVDQPIEAEVELVPASETLQEVPQVGGCERRRSQIIVTGTVRFNRKDGRRDRLRVVGRNSSPSVFLPCRLQSPSGSGLTGNSPILLLLSRWLSLASCYGCLHLHATTSITPVGVSMLAGSLAGITEHAVIFPVDSIKVRSSPDML